MRATKVLPVVAIYKNVDTPNRFQLSDGFIKGLPKCINIYKPFKIDKKKRQRIIESCDQCHITGLRFFKKNKAFMYGDLIDATGKRSLLIAWKRIMNDELIIELSLYKTVKPSRLNALKYTSRD